MSFITLIVIEKEDIKIIPEHYNTIIRIMNHDFKNAKHYLKEAEEIPLDAGYLLVDMNKKIIINGQSAFARQHLHPKYSTEWFWIEV
ncbi:hypothetical protein J4410_02250 [Candidatus Woesearchaeota archaeon]|nr:hypothetical protein [Candidatus Woesearchaeota archaeon]